jgi:outer membrane protein OmpA-like peptidoglycan-associated protein
MEQLMLANISAGRDEMLQLAARRARAAYNWLIERGSIPGDRVFVLEPKIEVEAESKKSGSRVEFSLR